MWWLWIISYWDYYVNSCMVLDVEWIEVYITMTIFHVFNFLWWLMCSFLTFYIFVLYFYLFILKLISCSQVMKKILIHFTEYKMYIWICEVLEVVEYICWMILSQWKLQYMTLKCNTITVCIYFLCGVCQIVLHTLIYVTSYKLLFL